MASLAAPWQDAGAAGLRWWRALAAPGPRPAPAAAGVASRPARHGIAPAELCGWTLLVAGLAYWGNVLRTTGAAGANALAFACDAVLRHGAFCAVAWAMIAALAYAAPRTGRASRSQIVAAIGIGLLCVVPTRQATLAALVGIAWLLLRPAGTRSARALSALLLGLAIELAWTSTYLMPLHDAAAAIDARAVQALLRLAGISVVAHGNIVAHVDDGFGIEILSFCASSYPLGGVALAFAVTTLYQGRRPQRRDLPWIAAAMAASIALTELRLTWMAVQETDYLWLHDGGGATLYGLAAVGLAALFPLLAVWRTPAPRATA